jgi:glucose-6-phosphate 1-dehydrogenase
VLTLQAKAPGNQMLTRPVDLAVSYEETLGEGPEAYEQLLDDAMDGDAQRFARQDAVEEAWRIVDGVLDAPPPVQPYWKGTWGPDDANEIAECAGGWRPIGSAHERSEPGRRPTAASQSQSQSPNRDPGSGRATDR